MLPIWFKRWRLSTLWNVETRVVWSKNKSLCYEECLCECWNKVFVLRYFLTTKWRGINSCWCIRREVWERNKHKIMHKHNMSYTYIYGIWQWILSRCNNANHKSYKNYWWRWIKCERDCFEQFYKDVWERPTYLHSIDRIDCNWNYCKENCRWADQKTQSRNRNNNIKYQWWWKSMIISDIIEHEGISNLDPRLVWARLKKWRTIEKAIYTDPTLYHNRNRWHIKNS